MRVSVAWLREWLSVVAPAEELAARLTMAGLEIEAVEPAAPSLEGVVVGEILSCERHPDADSLQICSVGAGGSEPLQIVCGAPNARPGLKAPLAQIGARLPGGMQISKASLRGVESRGMLCSARELGLYEDASGLMELPGQLETGQPLAEALSLEDTILDVNLTPNRGDCMSMLGVAREVAALTGAGLLSPGDGSVSPRLEDRFEVELEPGAGCARFASRVIRGVRSDATSPLWIQERLRRAGLRPINAVVDVTNYVMLELGQPMHAYDLAQLDRAIVVRRARSGESLTLLDGREIALDDSVMVIADRSKPIGLAGIMGGEHSGIGPQTSDVLLEVAFFSPDAVAGRGRRYGLVTDASQRFERGVDPTLQERAIERATRLLCETAGGEPGPTELTELVDELPGRAPVLLRPDRARSVIGAPISDAEIRSILDSLGVQSKPADAGLAVLAPSWRFDIEIEEDLIEEIARIYGFDRVPETAELARRALPELTERRVTQDAAADVLVQRGYHEAITYSFVDPALQRMFHGDQPSLALANPIAADLSTMRLSLWPGLAQALRENQRRQQARVRLFECGSKFVVSGGELSEVAVIAAIAGGAQLPEQWGADDRACDFFDLRADLEAVLQATGAAEEFSIAPAQHPALHPGQSARVLRGATAVGWIGRLHPELLRKLELTYSAVVFEIETRSALAAVVPHYREISRFPAVRRDLAVVVAEAVPVADLLAVVRAAAGDLLTDLVVFDIYRGQGIEPGCKSVAIGLNLQDVSRTLTDDESDAVVARVVADLGRECKATIRDK
jgi:phenylalanyl-tRNA synthetase beta chain